MEHGAVQLLANELGFTFYRLGIRNLRDHLASRGHPDALAAIRALEIGGEVLPQVRYVDVSHEMYILSVQSPVQIECTRGPPRCQCGNQSGTGRLFAERLRRQDCAAFCSISGGRARVVLCGRYGGWGNSRGKT